jgi:hypothetical protein
MKFNELPVGNWFIFASQIQDPYVSNNPIFVLQKITNTTFELVKPPVDTWPYDGPAAGAEYEEIYPIQKLFL